MVWDCESVSVMSSSRTARFGIVRSLVRSRWFGIVSESRMSDPSQWFGIVSTSHGFDWFGVVRSFDLLGLGL